LPQGQASTASRSDQEPEVSGAACCSCTAIRANPPCWSSGRSDPGRCKGLW